MASRAHQQRTVALPRGRRRDRSRTNRARQVLVRRAPDLAVLLVLAAAVAAVVAFLAYTSGPDGLSGASDTHTTAARSGGRHEPTRAPTRPPRTTAPAALAAPVPTAAPAPARATPPAAVTRLLVDAVSGPSWVVVRVGSATGKVLYAATLPQGQAIRAAAPRLFLRLGAASHVGVTVNGRPLQHALMGTVDVVLTPAGLAQP